jgi:DNA-binding CsgD family transcriptional regulator
VRRFLLAYAGRDVALPKGEFIIGRGQECDLWVEDVLVSRKHCRLRVSDEGVEVEDLGSRNGIFVNGRKIEKRRKLAHGDVMLVGMQEVLIVEDTGPQLPANGRFATQPPTKPLPKAMRLKPTPSLGTAILLDDDTKAPPIGTLSEREREVLEMLAQGYAQREVGEKLGVSVKTIETYRARLTQKLGLKSRAELVRYALAVGLLRK